MMRVFLSLLIYANLTNALQLAHLLSTCVDSCQRGCTEIRKVQASRQSSSLKVELKDETDPRSALTEADSAAQRVIIGSLRAEWGNALQIVGEEDDDDEELTLSDSSFKPLNRGMFDDDIGETAEIDPSDITIFVDPLDGTREFIEGRLSNCQVLVGIAIKGESVAGAVGIPFPDGGNLETDSTVIYGLADMGTGVVGSTLKRGPFPLEQNIDGVKYPRPHYATGDSPVEVIRESISEIISRFGGSNVIYGGAGNKILGAALGEVACSIQHKYGGPWDVCAPEAILKAMGGKMTDLFGNPIAIYAPDAPPNCNERGYVATGSGSDHESLCEVLLEGVPQIQKYKKEVMERSEKIEL